MVILWLINTLLCRRDPSYTGFTYPINYAAFDQALSRDHGVEGSNDNTVCLCTLLPF